MISELNVRKLNTRAIDNINCTKLFGNNLKAIHLDFTY